MSASPVSRPAAGTMCAGKSPRAPRAVLPQASCRDLRSAVDRRFPALARASRVPRRQFASSMVLVWWLPPQRSLPEANGECRTICISALAWHRYWHRCETVSRRVGQTLSIGHALRLLLWRHIDHRRRVLLPSQPQMLCRDPEPRQVGQDPGHQLLTRLTVQRILRIA